jgi:hypothetical protein
VTPDAKSQLEAAVTALLARWPYVPLAEVRRELARRELRISPATLRTYLHGLAWSARIHPAGRGWYSGLAEPFVADTAPVEVLAKDLAAAFPLVDFSCWSTAQVQGAMHHLLGRFVSVVHAEPDSLDAIHRHLRDAGWDCWLNPRGSEAERFEPGERCVVLRRASRKNTDPGPFASIESLLVDLFFEVRDLRLMALEDFHTMLANLAGTRRIAIGSLLSYAAERRITPDRLLGAGNQLIPPKANRRDKSTWRAGR